jgi:drug/metabolite transporter (DMT)-like permease
MDASFCSMFYPLQPLVSATLGVIFLGEKITVNYLVGAFVICCGIIAAVLSGKKKA